MSMTRSRSGLFVSTFQLALVLILITAAGAEVAGSQGRETSTALLQDDSDLAKPSPSPTPNTKQAATKKNTDKDATPKKPKRGQLVLAPIPINSPAIGFGLILAAGYVFKLNQDDKLSPPSVVGLAGAFSNNGSRGAGLGGRLYFSENKYQTTFVVAKGRINYDFFGIGRRPNDAPISVEIHQGGQFFW
jgi:hypothetical protein